jgi:hypothetical protein
MRAALFVAALSLARLALANEGEFALGTGANYSTGNYGAAASTQIWSVPVTARYDTGPWTFKATIPYLRISGPRDVIPDLGRVDRRNRSEPDTRTVTGLGDSSISAAYLVTGSDKRSGVGATVKVKLATGDETRGLGTGSNDASLQVDAFQRIERHTIFGVIGYTVFGDSPIVQFQNVANIGLGVSRRADGGDSFGVAFDARQGGAPAPAPQRELTGFWTHPLDLHWRTQFYLLKGFAQGSPDWGGGFSLAYSF